MDGVGRVVVHELRRREFQTDLVWAWIEVYEGFEVRSTDLPGRWRESTLMVVDSEGSIERPLILSACLPVDQEDFGVNLEVVRYSSSKSGITVPHPRVFRY